MVNRVIYMFGHSPKLIDRPAIGNRHRWLGVIPSAFLRRFVRLILLSAASFIVSVGGAGVAHASADFDPRKFAALVLNASTGEVLYQRDADAQRYPASLTKVMTLYLAFDALDRGDLKLTDQVIISPHAASRPPSKLWLTVGQSLTVKEAIDILVVKSANDVATALAERIAGSEPAFAELMTARARALGMIHTQYRNASGLPDHDHVCTARDLAILARAFLRDHPADYHVFDQQQTVFRGHLIPGHNALLRTPGIDGFKTGFTYASGFNLLTSGVRDGRRVIAVVLGGASARARDQFMNDLMRASFSSLTIKDAGSDVSVAALLGPEDPGALETVIATEPVAQIQAQESQDPVSAPQTARRDPSAIAGWQSQQWGVQVSLFNSVGNGETRLSDVRRRHPRHFASVSRRLDKIGVLYRASFEGFSASGASEACQLLISEGQNCRTMMPSRR